MDRGPVKIRQGQIDDLIKLYQGTYEKLTKEIINSTLAGKIQRAKVMVRINAELEALGVNVADWVAKEIPQYYQDGANQALQDLRSMGVDLSSQGSAAVNKEAIAALVDETQAAFGDGIIGMSRNARQILSYALKRQLTFILAEGKLRGSTLKAVAADVEQKLRESGLGVLTDRGGKTWQFDTYAQMLVRTKAVEARNTGLGNKMNQYGYDLVQVSNHGSAHPACHQWEGKILSVSGQTPGYPTLDQAKSSGLFHPNCEHAINVINLELANKTKAYDNPYLQEGTPPAPIEQTPAAPIRQKGKNQITLVKGNNSVTIPLTDSEANLLDKAKITVTTSDPLRRARRNVNGYYNFTNKVLLVKNMAQSEGAIRTFYHELGHVIDYELRSGARMINNEDVRAAWRNEHNQVVIQRMINSSATKEEATAWSQGKSYNGASISRRYLDYANSIEEVFADGYSQYRLNPKEFTQRAPMLAKIYKEVFND